MVDLSIGCNVQTGPIEGNVKKAQPYKGHLTDHERKDLNLWWAMATNHLTEVDPRLGSEQTGLIEEELNSYGVPVHLGKRAYKNRDPVESNAACYP